jgi:hypothetical protein
MAVGYDQRSADIRAASESALPHLSRKGSSEGSKGAACNPESLQVNTIVWETTEEPTYRHRAQLVPVREPVRVLTGPKKRRRGTGGRSGCSE